MIWDVSVGDTKSYTLSVQLYVAKTDDKDKTAFEEKFGIIGNMIIQFVDFQRKANLEAWDVDEFHLL